MVTIVVEKLLTQIIFTMKFAMAVSTMTAVLATMVMMSMAKPWVGTMQMP